MNMYKCKVCGYVYIPANGEPRTDTPAGTAFEDLPSDWFCPKCGAGKIRFAVTLKPW
jgi:rubredoxin